MERDVGKREPAPGVWTLADGVLLGLLGRNAKDGSEISVVVPTFQGGVTGRWGEDRPDAGVLGVLGVAKAAAEPGRDLDALFER
jgi:hypothetical protein